MSAMPSIQAVIAVLAKGIGASMRLMTKSKAKNPGGPEGPPG